MSLPLRNSRLRLSSGTIFWREVGQGPTLVFLHGSWSDGDRWLPTMELLSREYHCLAPDLLGFGESELPDVHYSIQLQLEFLDQYLETLNLRQVYLVGHSLGGWVATSYALKYADRVRGLILLAPEGVKIEGVRRDWWWMKAVMGRPKLVNWLLKSFQFISKLKLPRWLPNIKPLLRQWQQILESQAACQLLFLRRPAEIEAELLDDKLPWLKIPLLVLQGEKDSFAAKFLSQNYAKLAPEAQLKIIFASAYDLPEQQPEELANYIRQFVNREWGMGNGE